MRQLLSLTVIVALVLPLSVAAAGYSGVSGEGMGTQSDSVITSTQPGNQTSPNANNGIGNQNEKPIAAIPEPATVLLIGAGLVGAAVVHRRRR